MKVSARDAWAININIPRAKTAGHSGAWQAPASQLEWRLRVESKCRIRKRINRKMRIKSRKAKADLDPSLNLALNPLLNLTLHPNPSLHSWLKCDQLSQM